MKRKPGVSQTLGIALGICLLAAEQPASAGGFDRSNKNGKQLVVRVSPAEIEDLAAQFGLTIVAQLQGNQGSIALVEGPASMTPSQVIGLVGGDARVQSIEPALLASLPDAEDPLVEPTTADVVPDLLRSGEVNLPCLGTHVGEALWSGYADQRAAGLIRLHDAHAVSPDCGEATIAILDTGVDPDHPILVGGLVPGFDFLTGEDGFASEWSALDHSVSAILEHSVSAILEESAVSVIEGRGDLLVLDASIAPIVDPSVVTSLDSQQLPTYFGHGTMVAGIARLVAPGARIMPLRVFDGEGVAHLFDIVRAIYWAVDQGADVINMSFSMETHSPELLKAIQYARQHGVVCVAAAGNGGERTVVYPAAFGQTVGVASTDLDDLLSGFSNHGSGLVSLSAPGSGVVSTYPGGLFAAGWGTSFSAPLVSGAVALVHAHHPDLDVAAAQQLINALAMGSVALPGLEGEIGAGRLDVLSTLEAAE